MLALCDTWDVPLGYVEELNIHRANSLGRLPLSNIRRQR